MTDERCTDTVASTGAPCPTKPYQHRLWCRRHAAQRAPVGLEGVAFYLDGTKETRRVEETLSGRVTRTGRCRSQVWWPRGDSNTRHAV